MKQIIIVYILEYLILVIPTIIYELLGLNNIDYFITHYLPILSVISNIFIILILTKNNKPYIRKITTNHLYILISIGIIISCLFNTILFKLKPITPTNTIPLLINILSSGIIGPILEEILFRFILLNNLLKKYNKIKSLILGTLIFSLIHLSLIKIIYTLILGSIISIVYLNNNKNLLYPITIHISANIISIFLIEYNPYILSLSIILLIINIYLLKRKKEIIWHQQ